LRNLRRWKREGQLINRPSSTSDVGPDVCESQTSDDGTWLLYSGIKSILRSDSAAVVCGIAHYVVSQHRSLRLLSALIERTRKTPIPALVALVGGLRAFLDPHQGERRSDGGVWIARLSNERRVIEAITPLVPELVWTELAFRSRPDAAGLSTLARSLGPAAWRLFRIARQLHRRHEFFKVLRVVELIAFYSRYLGIFRNARFVIAVTSNHSNPHGIGFNLAARRCGLPVVLITHGLPVRPVAKLSVDLTVVHCEAARQTYLNEGCRMSQVLIHGRRQHYAAMPSGQLRERLAVAIFLCKDVNAARLHELLEHLLGHPRVAGIRIRPHPANLWRGLDAWTAARNDSRVRRSSGTSVFEDLLTSDIVLAGNSSALVDAVTAGRPSGYVAGLDYGSRDLHAFVASGLIYPIDKILDFDPDAMLRFYKRPEWSTVLRLFANVDEDQASIAASTAKAIRQLATSKELRHPRDEFEMPSAAAKRQTPAEGR